MKNGKKPTARQRGIIRAFRLNPENWLVCKDTPAEMHLINRHTGTWRLLLKAYYKKELKL